MKITRYILIAILAIISLVGNAKPYSVKDIKPVHLQNERRYVCNPDNILSEKATAEIDSSLYNLQQKTGIQTLVVVVNEIEGDDVFDFAFQLGEQNGVGEKQRDNGLVILLVTQLRKIQFATGYGLEGDLPDAICKRIQKKYMLKHFKRGDWDTGMVNGVKAVTAQLDGTMQSLEKKEKKDSGKKAMIAFSIALAAFIIVMLFLLLIDFINSKCPKCGKHWCRKRVSTTLISRRNGVKTEDVTYRCTNCGHTFTKREQKGDDSGSASIGGGIGGGIFLGGGGSFSGGGGFSGGSFGGGSFGGGGAGSNF